VAFPITVPADKKPTLTRKEPWDLPGALSYPDLGRPDAVHLSVFRDRLMSAKG
jgi:hypothetical protein